VALFVALTISGLQAGHLNSRLVGELAPAATLILKPVEAVHISAETRMYRGQRMRRFFDITFGPAELDMLEAALARWCKVHSLSRQSTEAALAAEVFINLFREGNSTLPQLEQAASRHKWLSERTAI
jgi:hypothetical protein